MQVWRHFSLVQSLLHHYSLLSTCDTSLPPLSLYQHLAKLSLQGNMEQGRFPPIPLPQPAFVGAMSSASPGIT